MGILWDKLHNRRQYLSSNKGFTLVELIVVLVLMSIMLSIGTFGMIGWIDWTRFQQEEDHAEAIFYAAQNQLTELDSSGALDRKLAESFLEGNNYKSSYILAQGKDTAATFSGYCDSKGVPYDWKTLWKDTDANLKKERKTILKILAVKGDYDRYLRKDSSLDPGTKFLFDLIASLISDEKVLNGAIALEFSPEAVQVFAVCYSDQVKEFSYSADTSDDIVNIKNRQLKTRSDSMVGYYAVDSLTSKKRGKDRSSNGFILGFENGDVLSMILHPKSESVLFENAELTFTILGARNYTDTYSPAFSFSVNSNRVTANSLSAALQTPLEVEIAAEKIYMGLYSGSSDNVSFRIPMWKDENGRIHIVLDAADIQAQSLTYADTFGLLGDAGNTETSKTSFRRTYSFYRFGLVNTRFLRAHVLVDSETVTGEGDAGREPSEDNGETEDDFVAYGDGPIFGEAATFANWESGDDDNTYGIENGRHLYNIRFESDYSNEFKNTEPAYYTEGTGRARKFVLKNDIDWSQFKGLVNSFPYVFDSTITDGSTYGIGLQPGVYQQEKYYMTGVNYAFPAFRMLTYSDSFEGKDRTTDEVFTLSGLNISLAANCVYGVYGNAVRNMLLRSQGDADYSSLNAYGKAGLLPLGLFAENSGEITNLKLNDIEVNGVESFKKGDQIDYLFTSRVGGFVGENFGKLTNLSVGVRRASGAEADSWIRGRMDVGGVVGHQYRTVVLKNNSAVSQTDEGEPDPAKTVTISGCINNAKVTGIGYVGGIIGRIYPKSSGSFDLKYTAGGSTTDYNARSLTVWQFANVFELEPADKIVIDHCANHGEISMDPSFAENVIDDNSYRRGFYFGGIAGAAFYGYNIENNSSTGYDFEASGFQRAVISNCESDTLYSTQELNSILNPGTDSEKLRNAKRLLRMQFVGGIVGASWYAHIENCSTTPDIVIKGTSSFIFGDRYVGGVAGYSIETRFFGDESYNQNELAKLKSLSLAGTFPNARNYSIINGTGVYGNYAVGGIAGAFGRPEGENGEIIVKEGLERAYSGSYSEGTMSIGYPFGCNKTDGNLHSITGLLNTAVVLGGSFNADINSTANEVISGEAAARCYYGVGGIAGFLATTIRNADYIQSEDTKKYYLSLISLNTGKALNDVSTLNNLSVADLCTIIDASLFVTDGTGGIVGEACENGNLNTNPGTETNTYNSLIDAVVFGRNRVGGAVGDTSLQGGKSALANMYPSKVNTSSKGMYVLGYENVGGLVGVFSDNGDSGSLNAKSDLDQNLDDNAFYKKDGAYTESFHVTGYRAVGGAIGTFYMDDASNSTRQAIYLRLWANSVTQIKGDMYVGGVVGIQEGYSKVHSDSSPRYVLRIQNLNVTADCFAGCIAGAIFSNSDYWQLDRLAGVKNEDDYKGYMRKVWVNQNKTPGLCFGVITGIYAYQGLDNVQDTPSSGSVLWNNVGGSQKNYLRQVEKGITVPQSYNGLHNIPEIDKLRISLPDSSSDRPTDEQYQAFVKSIKDVYNAKDVNGNIKCSCELSTSVEMDMRNFSEDIQEGGKDNQARVYADLYVGGVCGFIPDQIVRKTSTDKGYTLSVNFYRNRADLRVEKAIQTYEISDIDPYKYSYLGVVTGRIPSGMKVFCCKNTSNSFDGHYVANNASFIGGLAEINAGVVERAGYDFVTNKNGSYFVFYFYSGNYTNKNGGVSSIVGLNGTRTTDGEHTGVIKDSAYVTSRLDGEKHNAGLEGQRVGGIAVTAGGSSTISNCASYKPITVTKNGSSSGNYGAAGILYEVSEYLPANSNITVKLINDVFTNTITKDTNCIDASTAGIVLNSRGIAEIISCRNYGNNLTYAITSSELGKRAKSIKYCLDLSNSTNNNTVDKYTGFGCTVEKNNMMGNLYIGNKGNQTEFFTVEKLYSNNYKNAAGNVIEPGTSGPIVTYDEIENYRSSIGTSIMSASGWNGTLKSPDNTGFLTIEVDTVDESGQKDNTYTNMDAISIKWKNQGSAVDNYQYYILFYDSNGKKLSLRKISKSVPANGEVIERINISDYIGTTVGPEVYLENGFDRSKIQKIVIIMSSTSNEDGNVGISELSWERTIAGGTVNSTVAIDPEGRSNNNLNTAITILKTTPLSKLYFEGETEATRELFLYGALTGVKEASFSVFLELANSIKGTETVDSTVNNIEPLKSFSSQISSPN